MCVCVCVRACVRVCVCVCVYVMMMVLTRFSPARIRPVEASASALVMWIHTWTLTWTKCVPTGTLSLLACMRVFVLSWLVCCWHPPARMLGWMMLFVQAAVSDTARCSCLFVHPRGVCVCVCVYVCAQVNSTLLNLHVQSINKQERGGSGSHNSRSNGNSNDNRGLWASLVAPDAGASSVRSSVSLGVATNKKGPSTPLSLPIVVCQEFWTGDECGQLMPLLRVYLSLIHI